MAIYGYCRVSTLGQLDGNGLDVQRETIIKKYPSAQIIEEQGSGANLDNRPGLKELLSSLKQGDIFVSKLDRIARNNREGQQIIEDLHGRGVIVDIIGIGVFDDTAPGKLMLQIFLSFAEFERAVIRERLMSAKEYKKATDPNFKEGRKKSTNENQEKKIISLKKKDPKMSVVKIAEKLGLSKSVVGRILKDAKDRGELEY